MTDFNEHNIDLTLGKVAAEVRLALGVDADVEMPETDPAPNKNSLTPKQSKLRKMLEEKIIGHLEAATGTGLGKGDLKKLLDCDDYMNVSINTVKGAVDRLLKDGTIECVNPELERFLRFRLKRN